MAQQTNFIVFQCYGSEDIFYECIFALLSITRLYQPEELDNLEIWIYTDNPDWFKQFRGCHLPVYLRPIDGDLLQQWRGPMSFVHRVKLEMLIDFTQKRFGNVLYADTDVVFTHRLEPLFERLSAGELFMHTYEGVVSESPAPLMKKLNRYLQDNLMMQVRGKQVWDTGMWNAGVLGFNTRYRNLVEDALSFTDVEYPKFRKHIIEQFACSVYFQQESEVKAAAPWITHYWNLKEAREVLASFFTHYKNRIWDDLVQYSAAIQIPVLMQEKVNFLENRSVMGKITKKRWAPEMPEWKVIERHT